MSFIAPKTGIKNCLRCSNPFESWDVARNRICPKCTRVIEKEYIPRSIKSRVYHGDSGSDAVIDSEASS